jgi:tagaturonate reductase
MRLSRQTLRDITSRSCIVSEESRVQLSEKVSQFGTGMLLPGLPDYFFGKANRKGIFNGRVVVIKSTSKVDTSSLINREDYLHCVFMG